jgi:hypothetical protein
MLEIKDAQGTIHYLDCPSFKVLEEHYAFGLRERTRHKEKAKRAYQRKTEAIATKKEKEKIADM